MSKIEMLHFIWYNIRISGTWWKNLMISFIRLNSLISFFCKSPLLSLFIYWNTTDNCIKIGTQVLQLYRCRNDSISGDWDSKRTECRKGQHEWKRKKGWKSKRPATYKARDKLGPLIQKSNFLIFYLNSKIKFPYFWFVMNENFYIKLLL